jgi:hypothetical protein
VHTHDTHTNTHTHTHTPQAARLRDAEPALQRAAERAAAAASVADKVQLNAAAEERRAQLRQQEVRVSQRACVGRRGCLAVRVLFDDVMCVTVACASMVGGLG